MKKMNVLKLANVLLNSRKKEDLKRLFRKSNSEFLRKETSIIDDYYKNPSPDMKFVMLLYLAKLILSRREK